MKPSDIPMKTAKDIQTQFNATTRTKGAGNVYSCEVFINGTKLCEGLGSTLEKAEDTAFYGTKIML